MPSILEGGGGIVSLVDAGRNIYSGSRIGLSARARSLNASFFAQSKAGFTTIFALGTGPGMTVEGARTQIMGLRARLSESQLSESVRGTSVDTEA